MNLAEYPYNKKNRVHRDSGRSVHGCIMGSQPRVSLTQTELFDERTIRIGIAALQVILQFPATANHAQQATTRVVVFHVCLEVAGKLVDACSKQRKLYRSEEHTSELQSLIRNSYADFCL